MSSSLVVFFAIVSALSWGSTTKEITCPGSVSTPVDVVLSTAGDYEFAGCDGPLTFYIASSHVVLHIMHSRRILGIFVNGSSSTNVSILMEHSTMSGGIDLRVASMTELRFCLYDVVVIFERSDKSILIFVSLYEDVDVTRDWTVEILNATIVMTTLGNAHAGILDTGWNVDRFHLKCINVTFKQYWMNATQEDVSIMTKDESLFLSCSVRLVSSKHLFNSHILFQDVVVNAEVSESFRFVEFTGSLDVSASNVSITITHSHATTIIRGPRIVNMSRISGFSRGSRTATMVAFTQASGSVICITNSSLDATVVPQQSYQQTHYFVIDEVDCAMVSTSNSAFVTTRITNATLSCRTLSAGIPQGILAKINGIVVLLVSVSRSSTVITDVRLNVSWPNAFCSYNRVVLLFPQMGMSLQTGSVMVALTIGHVVAFDSPSASIAVLRPMLLATFAPHTCAGALSSGGFEQLFPSPVMIQPAKMRSQYTTVVSSVSLASAPSMNVVTSIFSDADSKKFLLNLFQAAGNGVPSTAAVLSNTSVSIANLSQFSIGSTLFVPPSSFSSDVCIMGMVSVSSIAVEELIILVVTHQTMSDFGGAPAVVAFNSTLGGGVTVTVDLAHGLVHPWTSPFAVVLSEVLSQSGSEGDHVFTVRGQRNHVLLSQANGVLGLFSSHVAAQWFVDRVDYVAVSQGPPQGAVLCFGNGSSWMESSSLRVRCVSRNQVLLQSKFVSYPLGIVPMADVVFEECGEFEPTVTEDLPALPVVPALSVGGRVVVAAGYVLPRPLSSVSSLQVSQHALMLAYRCEVLALEASSPMNEGGLSSSTPLFPDDYMGDVMDNPLLLVIPPLSDGGVAYVAGSLAGNCVLCVLYMVVTTLGSAGFAVWSGRRHHNQDGVVRVADLWQYTCRSFERNGGIVSSFRGAYIPLLQPFAMATVALLMNASARGGASVWCGLLGAAGVVTTTTPMGRWVYVVLVTWRGPTLPFIQHASRERRQHPSRGGSLKDAITAIMRRVMHPHDEVEWLLRRDQVAPSHAMSYLPVFDDLRAERHWYFVTDFLFAATMGGVTSYGVGGACSTALWLLVGLTALNVMVVLILRPYRSSFLHAFTLLLLLTSFGVVLMSALGLDSTATTVSYAQAVVSLLPVMCELLLKWRTGGAWTCGEEIADNQRVDSKCLVVDEVNRKRRVPLSFGRASQNQTSTRYRSRHQRRHRTAASPLKSPSSH